MRWIPIFIFFLLISVHSFGTIYYLSAAGDDSNSGTSPDQPWQTIYKLNSISLLPGDSVLFKSGDIFIGEIDLISGGTADSIIYFGKYSDGNLPLISGAREVTGWTLFDGNIYVAPFSGTPTRLFADDQQMTLARYPNQGYLFQQGGISDTAFVDSSLNEEPNYWKGANVRMRMNDQAWESRSVDSSWGNEVFINYPFVFSILKNYGYYFDGLFSLLDTAKEWFYNSDGQIYFYSPSGNDPSSLKVEATVFFYGIKLLNGAGFIKIENIRFEKQHLSGIASDNSSSSIVVDSCFFNQEGQVGIDLSFGGTHIEIAENSFSNCYGIGIKAAALDSANISRNFFKKIGTDPGLGQYNDLNGFAIVLDHSSFVDISQNEIDSCGSGGINLTASNCTVEKNVFTNNFLAANNDGVILNLGFLNEKNEIIDNFIFAPIGNNDATPNNPIYSDGIRVNDTCEACLISHNTITEASGTGIALNAGSSMYSIESNLIYGCKISQLRVSDGEVANTTNENIIRRNIFYAIHEEEDVVKVEAHALSYVPAAFDSNYYFNPYDYYAFDIINIDSLTHFYKYTLHEWQMEKGEDAHSVNTFFNTNRYGVVDSIGPELVVNGEFTNNLDNWKVTVEDNLIALLDNSTPLDYGCMKLVKTDSVPFPEGGVYSKDFNLDSSAFYKVDISNYSTRDANLRFYVSVYDSVFSPGGIDRYFPFYNYRQNYETIFQALKSGEHVQAQVLITYIDSLVWVDNISIAKVNVQYHDPHQLSRLFLNPTNSPANFDLGDSIFFNLDQQMVTNLLTLPPYSSMVLIFDSSMILSNHEPALIQYSMRVYPNPVSQGSFIQFQVKETESPELNFTMMDATGRVLTETQLQNFHSTLYYQLPREISAGIYLLRIRDESKTYFAKLLVQ